MTVRQEDTSDGPATESEAPFREQYEGPQERAARLARDLVVLISFGEDGGGTGDITQLFPLYPLHRPQILHTLELADATLLRTLRPQEGVDDDFCQALYTAAYTAITKDLDNIDPLVKPVFTTLSRSANGREKAYTLLRILCLKDAEQYPIYPMMRRSAHYAEEIFLEGTEWETALGDSELLGIIYNDTMSSRLKEIAFAELMKRQDVSARALVSMRAENLVRLGIDPLVLRSIYAFKLITGDFGRWALGLEIEDPQAARQVVYSLTKACGWGKFNIEDSDFEDAVMRFSGRDFFNSLGVLIDADIDVTERLRANAKRRLRYFVSLMKQGEELPQYIEPKKYIQYLCTKDPEFAQELWEDVIPVIEVVFGASDITYTRSFGISLAAGFSPLIFNNMSLLSTLGSGSSKNDQYWQELRNELFWSLMRHGRGQEQVLIEQYFLYSYKSSLNEVEQLVTHLFNGFDENEIDDFLSQEQLREFAMNLARDRKLKGSRSSALLLSYLAREAGITQLAPALYESLASINYTPDEAYFVTYFLPQLVRGQTSEVQAMLDQFRQIKKQSAGYHMDPVEDSEFWSEVQVWVALLIDKQPDVLELLTQWMENESYDDVLAMLKESALYAYFDEDEVVV